jgi:hypothetical protein
MAKGQKTGGRKVGTPNRDRRDLCDILHEKYPNYHPVIALAQIAHKSKNELLRFQAHKEVAKYICPQLKSVEINDLTPPNRDNLNCITFKIVHPDNSGVNLDAMKHDNL